jgi:hypothetical protein
MVGAPKPTQEESQPASTQRDPLFRQGVTIAVTVFHLDVLRRLGDTGSRG